MLDIEVSDEEYLYRGVVQLNWDFENDRPTSATFKDSQGVSVDRDGGREEISCIESLTSKKDFYAICKVLTQNVRDLQALVLCKPDLPQNPYHCEIHDSESRIPLRGKKPKKIRDQSVVVYKK